MPFRRRSPHRQSRVAGKVGKLSGQRARRTAWRADPENVLIAFEGPMLQHDRVFHENAAAALRCRTHGWSVSSTVAITAIQAHATGKA